MLAVYYLEQGQLTFRIEELPDGGVRVWVGAVASSDLHAATDGSAVTLNRAEAAEFGALLAEITDVLVRAHERGEAQAPPERSGEEQPRRERRHGAPRPSMRPSKPRSN